MLKKVVAMCFLVLFVCACVAVPFKTRAADQIVVEGLIEQIGDNGSFIMVNGQKLITSQELVDEAYFEVGDNVKIIAEQTEEGLKVIDYDYIAGDDLDDEE